MTIIAITFVLTYLLLLSTKDIFLIDAFSLSSLLSSSSAVAPLRSRSKHFQKIIAKTKRYTKCTTKVQLLTNANNNNNPNDNNSKIKFRQGKPSDIDLIRRLMIQNLMNPLFMNHERFIIAVNPDDDNDIYGFVQLRPLDDINTNNERSQVEVVDPNVFDALPGSSTIEDILQEEMMDDIWEDFDQEEIDFPTGLKSLPWSKEYKDYVQSSKRRREKNEERMKELDNLKKNIQYTNMKKESKWELASVYVIPSWRHKGIGSELVRKIITQHVIQNNRSMENVYLLTLDKTKEWYRRLGFEITNKPPASLKLEMVVGGIVTMFIGEKLVCMQGRQGMEIS